MRVSVLFLLAIFVFQIVEIPPPQGAVNPKTCCGRTVCLCTHAKGAFCPLKHKTQKRTQQLKESNHRRHCHLEVSQNIHDTGSDAIQPSRETSRTFPMFKKAPCHRDAPKTTLAGTSREFILASNAGPFLKDRIENLPLSYFQFSPLLQSKKIDHPPKSSFLSIFF